MKDRYVYHIKGEEEREKERQGERDSFRKMVISKRIMNTKQRMRYAISHWSRGAKDERGWEFSTFPTVLNNFL